MSKTIKLTMDPRLAKREAIAARVQWAVGHAKMGIWADDDKARALAELILRDIEEIEGETRITVTQEQVEEAAAKLRARDCDTGGGPECRGAVVSMERIREYYGVPAKRGMRIEFMGKPAVITGSTAMRLRARIDGEKKTSILHPTWEMNYTPEKVKS